MVATPKSILKELIKLKEHEQKVAEIIKGIVSNDEEETVFNKKSFKYIKKLDFYLQGGEELINDAAKSLEKHIEKSKDK